MNGFDRISIVQLDYSNFSCYGYIKKISKCIVEAIKKNSQLVFFSKPILSKFFLDLPTVRQNSIKNVEDKLLKILIKFSEKINIIIDIPIEANNFFETKTVLIKNKKIVYDIFFDIASIEKYKRTNGLQKKFLNIGNGIKFIVLQEPPYDDFNFYEKLANYSIKNIFINKNMDLSSSNFPKKIKFFKKISDIFLIKFIFINSVGICNEKFYNGMSSIILPNQKYILKLSDFKYEILHFDFNKCFKDFNKSMLWHEEEYNKFISSSLINATRFFFKSVGIRKAAVGLSGGIDSSLTAAILVKALGCENVTGICMPSKYTSKLSIKYAKLTASLLSIDIKIVPISELHEKFLQIEFNIKDGIKKKIADENIQARIRGLIMMKFSNLSDSLIVSTSNKSEVLMGYCTLYGDTVGGFNILKYVYKTQVYKISRYLNKIDKCIPNQVINRAPTAELSENQKDSDFLPKYNILDKILNLLIDKKKGIFAIEKMGYQRQTIKFINNMVTKNSYKKIQIPPGILI